MRARAALGYLHFLSVISTCETGGKILQVN